MSTTRDEIKAGDVVELASGGPEMTVVNITSSVADVCWFSENLNGLKTGMPDRATLPVSVLRLVKSRG